jgi:hypothetical protein
MGVSGRYAADGQRQLVGGESHRPADAGCSSSRGLRILSFRQKDKEFQKRIVRSRSQWFSRVGVLTCKTHWYSLTRIICSQNRRRATCISSTEM